MPASKIFSKIVSFSSVPILKVLPSSSFILTSLCKNFPYKDSFDIKISFNPSLANFFALRKLTFSPS